MQKDGRNLQKLLLMPGKKGWRPKRKLGYDYSSQGLYFLTLITKGKTHCFGRYVHTPAGRSYTLLNFLGETAYRFWMQIPEHYPHIVVHAFVVVPNHLHGILEICADPTEERNGEDEKEFDQTRGQCPTRELGRVVRAFKAAVTAEARKFWPEIQLWAPGFHDWIITSQSAHQNMLAYIAKHPAPLPTESPADSPDERPDESRPKTPTTCPTKVGPKTPTKAAPQTPKKTAPRPNVGPPEAQPEQPPGEEAVF